VSRRLAFYMPVICVAVVVSIVASLFILPGFMSSDAAGCVADLPSGEPYRCVVTIPSPPTRCSNGTAASYYAENIVFGLQSWKSCSGPLRWGIYGNVTETPGPTKPFNLMTAAPVTIPGWNNWTSTDGVVGVAWPTAYGWNVTLLIR
jgi:hypothetical protein